MPGCWRRGHRSRLHRDQLEHALEVLDFDTCTGEPQQWEVEASILGKERFEAGPAIAVAVGRTTDRGEPTDAHQWLVEIMLIEE